MDRSLSKRELASTPGGASFLAGGFLVLFLREDRGSLGPQEKRFPFFGGVLFRGQGFFYVPRTLGFFPFTRVSFFFFRRKVPNKEGWSTWAPGPRKEVSPWQRDEFPLKGWPAEDSHFSPPATSLTTFPFYEELPFF